MKHSKNIYMLSGRISRVALSFLLQKFSYFFGSVFYFYISTAIGLGGVRVQVSQLEAK